MPTEYKSRLNRSTMTCSVVRKRRPRPWTAKAVGRVYCEAKLSGVSESEMRDAMKKCGGESECDCERLNEIITQQRDILAAVEIFLGLLAGLRVTIAVARRAKLAAEEAREVELSAAAERDVEKLKKLIRLGDDQLAVAQEASFKRATINITP